MRWLTFAAHGKVSRWSPAGAVLWKRLLNQPVCLPRFCVVFDPLQDSLLFVNNLLEYGEAELQYTQPSLICICTFPVYLPNISSWGNLNMYGILAHVEFRTHVSDFRSLTVLRGSAIIKGGSTSMKRT